MLLGNKGKELVVERPQAGSNESPKKKLLKGASEIIPEGWNQASGIVEERGRWIVRTTGKDR